MCVHERCYFFVCLGILIYNVFKMSAFGTDACFESSQITTTTNVVPISYLYNLGSVILNYFADMLIVYFFVFRALKRSGEIWEKHYQQLHVS